MSTLVVVILGGLIGYVSRRWLVVFVGPAAGAAVIGLTAAQHQNVWDTPSVFVAVTATVGLVLGVALRRATHPGGDKIREASRPDRRP